MNISSSLKEALKSLAVIFGAVLAILVILVSADMYSSQSEYLSLGYWDKSIESVRFYTFTGEPYYSLMTEEGTATERTDTALIEDALDRQYLCERPSADPVCYADVTFTDGTAVQAEIYEDVIGLGYGTVCIKAPEGFELYEKLRDNAVKNDKVSGDV